jgi:hypothetical protein
MGSSVLVRQPPGTRKNTPDGPPYDHYYPNDKLQIGTLAYMTHFVKDAFESPLTVFNFH